MSLSRVKRMLALAQARGLDALAVMPGPNLFYMTGLSFMLSERPILGLFPVGDKPALVLPALEAGKSTEFITFPYTDEGGYALAFHEACAKLELVDVRIGVETLRMRLLEGHLIQRYAPGSDLVPADDLFAELRMQKDAEELATMRRAVAVAEGAFQAWLTELRVGMTEKQAASRLVAALLQAGADGLSFDPIVASGPNGGLPHAAPSERRFHAGDWVVVDWGARVAGYASDITRMVVFGRSAGPLVDIYQLVLAANQAGRAVVKPGIPAEAVDAATRRVIVEKGFGPRFMHRTGHGLGLEAHESPSIVAGNTTVLKPGMTFTVEPGIYIAGLGGIRIEDDVAVTEMGGVSLTTLPRAPFILPAR